MDVSELLLDDGLGYNNDDDLPPTQKVDDRVLKGVTAYVEVRSSNDNRSEAIRRELLQLGASVEKKFTNDVTHVVFKEGSNRTKSKAEKKGLHLVSVLWVENCKLNQEHVSERMYPAVVPKLKGTPLLMTKLKKAKSMQPKDFEEELANSAERVRRKRKKVAALNSLSESTPSNSPYLGAVLVTDTQPHSQQDGFVLTPLRLTIPETPPSMREKLKQLRLAKAEAAGSYTNSDFEDDLDLKELNFKQLQKNLFNGSVIEDGASSVTYDSPNDISSILTEDNEEESITKDNEGLPEDPYGLDSNKVKPDVLNVSAGSESSVTNDILSIAQNINATLNSPSGKSVPCLFGFDSDENLLSSQEIGKITNSTVKLKPTLDEIKKPDTNMKQTVELSDVIPIQANISFGNTKTDIVETSSRKIRRSSRRLSVQQAVQALNQSSLLDLVPEKDNTFPKLTQENDDLSKLSPEKDDTLPKQGHENEILSTNAVGDKTSVDIPSKRKSVQNNRKSEINRKRKGSSCVGEGSSIEKKQNKRKSHVSSAKCRNNATVKDGVDLIQNQTLSEKNTSNVRKRSCDNHCDEQDNSVASVEDKKASQKSKGKKTMKKKLMPLNDLCEQNSVLLVPSTCSSIDRPQLVEETVDKPSRKGGRRKSDRLNASDKHSNDVNANKNDATSKLVQTDTTNKRGRKRKSSDICPNNSSTGSTDVPGRKSSVRGRRKTNAGRSSTLVNDTYIDQGTGTKSLGLNSSDAPIAKIQDVSTQLNLTKDNSLVCSIRETTLSLSMSTAYTDANMPSFLSSQTDRRSIDEFNASQKRHKKQKLVEKSVLSSIGESMYSHHNKSDAGVNRKMRSFNSGGKLFRPSIVMTSLHSCEQDVVISVVKKLGGFIIAENVNETTTHVICGEPRRTLNVIRCLARGIWLVTKEWAITSLELGSWVPETGFEYTSSFPMCKVARLERNRCDGSYRQALFNNVGPIYVSGKSQPPRSQLVELIRLCGGQVISVKDQASVYLGSDYLPGMVCVKTTWLLDCITNHLLMPMDMYYLDRPKKESSPEY